MPNWCDNNLVVKPTFLTPHFPNAEHYAELDRFMEYASGYSAFDFESILPQPSELQNTQSPPLIISQEEYDSIDPMEWAEMCSTENPFKSKPITQEMSDRYKELYGADNWYDWCLDNWGTKWGAIDPVVYEEGHKKSERLRYEFRTAWSPPTGIISELSKQFYNLEFVLHWEEEGGLAGEIRAFMGDIVKDILLEREYDEEE